MSAEDAVMDERLIPLEERLAYLERRLELLDEALIDQQAQLDEMAKTIDTLVEQYKSDSPIKMTTEEEPPPPHY